eukprot:CAMPEP_0168607778 /NCGR_PEP_ID=MMETSP0449_2-20121227/247_1 /TAXON_ID=1082188 /ORGANISM="Strombidium rassoulzadegani, Strain ras09" /LENGTH=75 /DNA_ID=CAMNT_0008647663 /DNA_START=105 /DNA_END=332 /DNA_ORIENTATION=-
MLGDKITSQEHDQIVTKNFAVTCGSNLETGQGEVNASLEEMKSIGIKGPYIQFYSKFAYEKLLDQIVGEFHTLYR